MQRGIHWVREAGRIRALTSPTRQRILDRLEAIGPASIKDLADRLGLEPDRLYYHVRLLLKHRFVKSVGYAGSGREREALYDLAHRKWHLDYDAAGPAARKALDGLTKAMLRLAQRDFSGALERGDGRSRGGTRNLWSLRLEARLNRSELRALQEHLAAIVEILRKKDRGDQGELVALTWILAPLVDGREKDVDV